MAFSFGSPYFFFLLVPAALAARALYRRRTGPGLVFPFAHAGAGLRPTWRTAAVRLTPALFLAGLALAIVALARPHTVLTQAPRTADAITIELVMDVSGSMQALDLSTWTPQGRQYRTRLDVVKDTFASFVERRPDDLIGLVTFGGYATTRCPLTLDHDALLHVLRGVEMPGAAPDGALPAVIDNEELLTAIGDALATASARIEGAPTRTKVVVLLSDGESNTGVIDPLEAAGVARRLGVRVYTIGVGSTGKAPVWARGADGARILDHRNVVLDEKLLQAVARVTAGRYFNVQDPQALTGALSAIDALERTRITQMVYSQYNEWFAWLLAPALALVAVSATLNAVLVRRVV